MSKQRLITGACPLAITLTLAACGGGGGTDTSGGGAASYPAAGAYQWILRAAGSTDALKFGLSLVHSTDPETEYVIESARDTVSDARVAMRGTVEPGQLRATALQAHTLVYIVGGDVRSVPLQADGRAPASRVQRAQSTSACSFVIDANDHASPENSRYIVSTAGADGQCDTADDRRAEVRLAASGALGYTALTGDLPLDVVRDPAGLAPRGWIYPRQVVLWSTSSATTIATRTAPAAAVTAVVGSSHNSALVEDGSRLALLTMSAATVNETLLDPTLTVGNGWQPIGHDADAFYVFINSGSTFTSTWRVVKVSRAVPAATQLASGTGLVTVASMGQGLLYLTVFGQSENKLIRLPKSGGTPAETRYATNTLATVLTSASAVHQRWTVAGIGNAAPVYQVDFVDETDAVLHSVPGGFPIAMAEAEVQRFDRSESRTRFAVAGNYGDRGFADASLIGYDAATRTATTVGTLPGTATFGASVVFANAIAGPGARGAGFAARSVNGRVEEAGAKVFSFDLGVASSLKSVTTSR